MNFWRLQTVRRIITCPLFFLWPTVQCKAKMLKYIVCDKHLTHALNMCLCALWICKKRHWDSKFLIILWTTIAQGRHEHLCANAVGGGEDTNAN